MLWFCVALVGSGACSASDLTEQLYKAGQHAERAGDALQAYLYYARAAALEPDNAAYVTRKAALQSTVALRGEMRVDADPAAEGGGAPIQPPIKPEDERQILPPQALAGSPEKKSFDLKGDARTIFERVAAAYGLVVSFDGDYQPPPPFTFRMEDATFEDAFRTLEIVSNSFLIPINPHLAMVARDTPQKRNELGAAAAAEIPIPTRISVQEAQEIVTAVQQTLDIRRIVVDPTRHKVFVRDQASKVAAARALFDSLARLRPQVEVELQFLSVEKTSSLNLGLSLPTSFPLVDFGHFLGSTPAIPSGYTNFLSFGGGATFLGLGITAANAFANASKNTTSTLLEAQVVSLDGQAATLHVGNRYPIITNGYYGNATGTGTVYTPPPTVNYTDLGLVFKVTPSVHADEEVTLDIESEFNILGAASSISGIPVVSSRKFTGKVRLKEGEWAVIAGLIQLTDSDTTNGVAGTFSLPLLGKLLNQNQREHDTADVLVVVKPRIVSLPPWEEVTPTIWVGSETRPVSLF